LNLSELEKARQDLISERLDILKRIDSTDRLLLSGLLNSRLIGIDIRLDYIVREMILIKKDVNQYDAYEEKLTRNEIS